MDDRMIVDCSAGEDDEGAVTLAPAEPMQIAVPTSVSNRQARLALFEAGHLSGVDAALDALPSPQREAARIEWDYATDIRRDSPLVASIGSALDLDESEIDELFRAASAL